MSAVKLIILTVQLYGNFTTMGVVVELPQGLAPDGLGKAAVYLVEDGARRPVHDLVQVGSTNILAGSLFSAFKNHVLKEVRYAAVCFFLVSTTDLYPYAQGDRLHVRHIHCHCA